MDDAAISDLLLKITIARTQINDENARIEAAVKELRAAGVPWETIAIRLGTTRQAAQQRFGSAVAG